MVRGNDHYPIDQELQQLASADGPSVPRRAEFIDPVNNRLQSVSLSRVIDKELERFYNPSGPVEVITRVFRRLRGRAS